MADTLWGDPEPLPPALWTVRTKRPEVMAFVCCHRCGRRPASPDTLPAGWGWDTLEPSNPYVWCPVCAPDGPGAEQLAMEWPEGEA